MMLPIELGHRIEDSYRLAIDLQLSPELDWFQGHFDNVPILPGVTQINWVMHYAKSLLGVDAFFSGIDVVKFRQPLTPGMILALQIDWQADKDTLIFSYRTGEQLASSGKIALCR